MEFQHIYEIPSQDAARETVAVEMNNFSETDNEGVSPEVVYVRVKLKGKDYMCCSVFNIMFCNCLFLGCAALICSLKARSKMDEGDMVKAQKYSRRACRTNTMAVIVTSFQSEVQCHLVQWLRSEDVLNCANMPKNTCNNYQEAEISQRSEFVSGKWAEI
ncbi:hypothetical protein QQF64_024952 [Cirrhinus molitorella]|uniref:Uncharacterized protein n=1 Tax=Cirrhinus molitorella TaxID=172907 RepID=A0ABR3NMN3_9TELE